jgi:TIR domain
MTAKGKVLIFVSYSHHDAQCVKAKNGRDSELIRRLKAINDVKVFSDNDLTTGEEFGERIRDRLVVCRILIPLISEDFLASKYCMKTEVGFFRRIRKRESTEIMPLWVKPGRWRRVQWLRKLQILPQEKPLSAFRDPTVRSDLILRFIEDVTSVVRRVKT